MKHLFCAALALACLFASGCATEASNRIRVTPSGHQIEVRNAGLQAECAIREGGATLYEGDILAAWVLLESRLDEKKVYEVRWTWEDSDGFELKGNRGWDSIFVTARDEHKVEGRAPSAKAVRGIFQLRYHSGETDGDE